MGRKRRQIIWEPEKAVRRYRTKTDGPLDSYRYRITDRRIARRERRRWIRAEEIFLFERGALIRVTFYEDGLVTLGYLAMTPKEFRHKVRCGEVTAEPPRDTRVRVGPGILLVSAGGDPTISADDVLVEVDDIFDRLRGRPDSSTRCLLAIGKLIDHDSRCNRHRLERALNGIPAHKRVYLLGDMDAKLGPVEALLGDDREERRAAIAYFRDHLPGLLKDRGAKR